MFLEFSLAKGPLRPKAVFKATYKLRGPRYLGPAVPGYRAGGRGGALRDWLTGISQYVVPTADSGGRVY